MFALTASATPSAVAVFLAVLLAAFQHRLDLGLSSAAASGLNNGQPQQPHAWVTALRGYQGVLAGALYAGTAIACARIAPPGQAHWLMLPLSQVPYQLLYNLCSLNRAGGYYSSHREMYTRLSVHANDIKQRDQTTAHRDGLAKERRDNIFRCVNGLEAGVVSGAVAVVAALLGAAGLAIPVAAQTAFVVLGNLAISFAWFGLPHQWPEALWQLDPGASGLRAQLAPLQRCPEPSY